MQTFVAENSPQSVDPTTILGYIEVDGVEGFNGFEDTPVRHEDKLQDGVTVISLLTCEEWYVAITFDLVKRVNVSNSFHQREIAKCFRHVFNFTRQKLFLLSF